MIINDRLRFCYLQMPKTGSRSLCNWLLQIPDTRRLDLVKFDEAELPEPHFSRTWQHDMVPPLDAIQAPGWTFFTTFRDYTDRAISLWDWLTIQHWGTVGKGAPVWLKGFEAFCSWLLDVKRGNGKDWMWRSDWWLMKHRDFFLPQGALAMRAARALSPEGKALWVFPMELLPALLYSRLACDAALSECVSDRHYFEMRWPWTDEAPPREKYPHLNKGHRSARPEISKAAQEMLDEWATTIEKVNPRGVPWRLIA